MLDRAEGKMSTGPTFLSRLAQAGNLLFDGETRQQYAAICHRPCKNDNGHKVLLITTRGAGRWTVPKGWPMKDRQPHQVAEQEALEEAGIKGKADRQPLGLYTYAKQLDDGRIAPCLVQVFALKVDKVTKNFKERGQRARKWVSLTEAQNIVEEPELRGLLMQLDQRLCKSK